MKIRVHPRYAKAALLCASLVRDALHAMGHDVKKSRLVRYANGGGFALVIGSRQLAVEHKGEKRCKAAPSHYKWDASERMYRKRLMAGVDLLKVWHPEGWKAPVTPKPSHHFRIGDHIYRIGIA